MTEFWRIAQPFPGTSEQNAIFAEEHGGDGLLFTDSQHHNGDCYAALAIAAKSTK